MQTEKAIIQVEAVYSKDKQHRYLVKRSWDTSLPTICVIMLSPSNAANTIAMDMTSMYTVNNCHKLGFGTVSIANIFSNLDGDFENTPDNDAHLQKLCKEADTVVLAWGKGNQTKQVLARLQEILKLLRPFQKKLVEISDGNGTGFHPLGRTVRAAWKLVPFKLPEEEKVDATGTKKA